MRRPARLPFGIAAILVALVLAGSVAAQRATTETPAPDITKLGPQVGEKVPPFTLQDQRGNPRRLASLMGPHGLILVFSRSADW
ncbi:MAG TPA: hypothetical protein VFA59_09885 [Vicinamibacterales bacterium]|nr:hypothetical protein [Vicinamibacterales bacterium]